MRLLRVFPLFCALLVAAVPTWAQTDLKLDVGEGPVFVVPVQGTIDNALATYIGRAIAEAEEQGASVVLLDVDTFGGLVDAADEIRKTLLDATVPIVAVIDKNAASAGALISYAADRIVMVPGASMGAATVVNGVDGAAAPDKYQSYMRSQMRATAEANGRDPAIAEAMVDQDIEIPGVTAAGEVLTLSTNEALDLGVADASLGSLDEVQEALGLSGRQVVQHRATGTETFLRFLGSPVVASILMLMMMSGLYFEFQTPGVGFAGMAAFVGAALFFAPHYMLGLVESWEIVLFIVGVMLLAIELLVIPGFGVAGAAGILLVVTSLGFGLIGNVGLSFPSGGQITQAIVTMAVTMLLLVGLMYSLGRYLPSMQRVNRLVLQPELGRLEGYIAADTNEALAGRTGRALSALRPSGTVEVDGERLDALTRGDFIAVGAAIEVVRSRGSYVEVRQARTLSESQPTST